MKYYSANLGHALFMPTNPTLQDTPDNTGMFGRRSRYVRDRLNPDGTVTVWIQSAIALERLQMPLYLRQALTADGAEIIYLYTAPQFDGATPLEPLVFRLKALCKATARALGYDKVRRYGGLPVI